MNQKHEMMKTLEKILIETCYPIVEPNSIQEPEINRIYNAMHEWGKQVFELASQYQGYQNRKPFYDTYEEVVNKINHDNR